MAVEFQNALTCTDGTSSTIHKAYSNYEMKYRVLRKPLGEENP
jgi:hypothetical protein